MTTRNSPSSPSLRAGSSFLLLGLLLFSGCQDVSPTETTGGGTTSAPAAVSQKDPNAGNSPKKSRVLFVALTPRPTNPRYSGSFPGSTHKLFIDFVDGRDPKDTVGKNTEEANKPPVIVRPAAGTTPLEFVRAQLLQDLHDNNVIILETSDSAGRTVTARLLKFWAEESPSYRGDVRMAVEVKDVSGKVLWSGTCAGANSRFGRSLKPDNYNECLTDSTIDMIGKLLGNSNFQSAVAQ